MGSSKQEKKIKNTVLLEIDELEIDELEIEGSMSLSATRSETNLENPLDDAYRSYIDYSTTRQEESELSISDSRMTKPACAEHVAQEHVAQEHVVQDSIDTFVVVPQQPQKPGHQEYMLSFSFKSTSDIDDLCNSTPIPPPPRAENQQELMIGKHLARVAAQHQTILRENKDKVIERQKVLAKDFTEEAFLPRATKWLRFVTGESEPFYGDKEPEQSWWVQLVSGRREENNPNLHEKGKGVL